jgi:hypothetical protein
MPYNCVCVVNKVEIPAKRAGVVITNDGQVENKVLRSGKQIVRTNSQVVLYDVTDERLENKIGFLFKDAHYSNNSGKYNQRLSDKNYSDEFLKWYYDDDDKD